MSQGVSQSIRRHDVEPNGVQRPGDILKKKEQV